MTSRLLNMSLFAFRDTVLDLILRIYVFPTVEKVFSLLVL